MGNIYCLIGPSGVGKSTLARKWGLKEVVSHRTRPIRPAEIDGVDGHFITKEKFAIMNRHGDFIAQTVYVGNNYGVTKEEMKKADTEDVVYVVDMPGALELKQSLGERVIMISLMGDDDTLKKRMLDMGRSFVDVQKRLNKAEEERKVASKCDYHVENKQDQLDATIDKLERIRELVNKRLGVKTS